MHIDSGVHDAVGLNIGIANDYDADCSLVDAVVLASHKEGSSLCFHTVSCCYSTEHLEQYYSACTSHLLGPVLLSKLRLVCYHISIASLTATHAQKLSQAWIVQRQFCLAKRVHRPTN